MMATERQADAAIWSVYLGFAGLVGIVGTIFFTRRAAVAANKAVEIAELALIDLERPHLFVDISPIIKIQVELNAFYPKAVFSFADYGRFPADIIRCSVDIYNGDDPFGHRLPAPNLDFLCFVVGADKVWQGLEIFVPEEIKCHTFLNEKTSVPEMALPVKGKFTTVCRINLVYKGARPTTYTTEFLWRWDHGPNRWTLVCKNRT